MPRPYADITVSVNLDRDEHAALVEWGKVQSPRMPLSVILRTALNEYLRHTGIQVMMRDKVGRKPGPQAKRGGGLTTGAR